MRLTKTPNPIRYLVFFPGYNPQDDEMYNNYASYNTKLDDTCRTSALSMAYDSARRYNGVIYTDNGMDITPLK